MRIARGLGCASPDVGGLQGVQEYGIMFGVGLKKEMQNENEVEDEGGEGAAEKDCVPY